MSGEKKGFNANELTLPKFVCHKAGQLRQFYDVKEQLGSGAFGEVCRCVHKESGELRAVKMVRKENLSKTEKYLLITEIENLKSLEHPNILQIYETYECPVYYYIVTELCQGGELFDEIERRGKFSEQDAIKTMKALLSAINYCHTNNIMHRDLKPENILLESRKDFSSIKLIDFGYSKRYSDPNKYYSELVGTAMYVAPETINGAHNYKSDIWSCGVICYILLTGSVPFWDDDEDRLFELIKTGKFEMNDPCWIRVPVIAQEFVKRLLTLDKNERPTAQKCLNDSWLSKEISVSQRRIKQEAGLAFENIIKFNSYTKMKQIVYSYIIQQQTSKKEKESYRKVFQAIDVDNNGVLSQDEFLKTAKQFFGESLTQEQCLNLFLKADGNNNGVISFNEFVLASMDYDKLHNDKKLRAAFKMFDRNNDGSIAPEEVLEVFKGTEMFDIKMAQKMIGQLDTDGDGKISFVEFEKFMKEGDILLVLDNKDL